MTGEIEGASGGLSKFLDRSEILAATVEQLSKDLSVGEDRISIPALGEGTFELLRSQVTPIMEELQAAGTHALQVAMYRVDITENRMHWALGHGGVDTLAGEVVLRCLQKVLTRMRHSGRF